MLCLENTLPLPDYFGGGVFLAGVFSSGVFLRFVLGRTCEGLPATRSVPTEYTCSRVWRARNPSAPRQTLAGDALRITFFCDADANSAWAAELASAWLSRRIISSTSFSSAPN